MDASDSDRPRLPLSRAGNPLVRLVGRMPITVQRKLLIAFGIILVLLVTVGVLGIGVLNEANDRVDTLGLLPVRQAAYRELAIDSDQLDTLLQGRNAELPCLLAPRTTCLNRAHLPHRGSPDGRSDQSDRRRRAAWPEPSAHGRGHLGRPQGDFG